MNIGSRLIPQKSNRTYFHSGRGAFSFLIGSIIKPKKVYLPAFTCWSLVIAMQRLFPEIELAFYQVKRDLTCCFPSQLESSDLLIIIHYFGHENTTALPAGDGIVVEDFSHSHLSSFKRRGHFAFGSLRKILNIADGGFVDGFFNPVYEPSRRLDSWVRLQATDWRDLREAENMLDRHWEMADISSQSLVALLEADTESIRSQRRANDAFLTVNLSVGTRHIKFSEMECPMIHNRLMNTPEERDSLRAYLAENKIFTSVHWPTHEVVRKNQQLSREPLWLEKHVISFPISHDYDQSVMAKICEHVATWAKK